MLARFFLAFPRLSLTFNLERGDQSNPVPSLAYSGKGVFTHEFCIADLRWCLSVVLELLLKNDAFLERHRRLAR